MWARLDDSLLGHRKLLEAARLLGGHDAHAKVLGWYTASLLYSARHLTDGKLTPAIVDELRVPKVGERALIEVGLWKVVDKRKGAIVIHDWNDWNPSAADVLEKRKQDRERKRQGGRHRHGGNNGARA